MKDVPSFCSHASPTKADLLAREKTHAARQLSPGEVLVLLALTVATTFFALQPAPAPFAPPAAASEVDRGAAHDEARPPW
jgi:hypothetical protein